MPCWRQRSEEEARLVPVDRKALVTQITSRYNQGTQKSIFERTTRRTLEQTGYSSRRPHQVPLLWAKNRKLRLQFAWTHQNWPIEDWKKVAWSDESWFLLWHWDGQVRIWRKQHESMDPSCLVSTVQAGGGGVKVWGLFSWHTLGPLVPISSLNTTAYMSIVTDHVHPFMTIFWWRLPAGQRTMSQSSDHLKLVSWTWHWVHCTQMASTVTRSHSNRALKSKINKWYCPAVKQDIAVSMS